MKVLILIAASLSLIACSGSGGSGSKAESLDPALIVTQGFETDEVIIDFTQLQYNGGTNTDVYVKGAGSCNARVYIYPGTVIIDEMIGPCAYMNGEYRYRIVSKCRGYQQSTFICGQNVALDIVLTRQ